MRDRVLVLYVLQFFFGFPQFRLRKSTVCHQHANSLDLALLPAQLAIGQNAVSGLSGPTTLQRDQVEGIQEDRRERQKANNPGRSPESMANFQIVPIVVR